MKKQHLFQTVFLGALLLALSLSCWLRRPDSYSASERRLLAQRPALSAAAVADGSFMEDFEAYTLDQFPLRDRFRTLKTAAALGVFGQKDSNGLYVHRGYAAKLDHDGDPAAIDRAAEKFNAIHDQYLAGTDVRCYLAVIPDKNHFLAAESGHLSADYAAITAQLQEACGWMARIRGIEELLSAEDYYRTDSHWRQECIVDVAQKLASGMGAELSGDYTENIHSEVLRGVYADQLALPMEPDPLIYLTNAAIDGCTVTSYASGKAAPSAVYDLAPQRDPYDLYLGGADPLMILENPLADTDRELVIFRDSFGSSIAPLLLDGYAKITLVDIRYIQSSMLGFYLTFTDQDVLFLYSTSMLQSSLALK